MRSRSARSAARRASASFVDDVAPTILHLLGVPVPEDMDGCVLREVFVEASDLARRETVFQPAVARDEERRVSERVRKLLGLRKI